MRLSSLPSFYYVFNYISLKIDNITELINIIQFAKIVTIDKKTCFNLHLMICC